MNPLPADLEAYLYESSGDLNAWEIRFSWTIEARHFSHDPVPCRIVAATTLSRLERGKYDVWETDAEARTNFYFVGASLPQPTRTQGIYWRVGVDRADGKTDWSAPARLVLTPRRKTLGALPWIGLNGESPNVKTPAPERLVTFDLRRRQPLVRVEFSPFTPEYFRLETGDDPERRDTVCLADFTTSPHLVSDSRLASKIETKAAAGRFLWLSGVRVPPGALNGLPLEVLITVEGRRGAFGFVVPATHIIEGGPKPAALAQETAPNVLLKRTVDITAPIREAVCTYTGLGYCELYINGQPVTDDLLWPPFTDFTHRVYARSLDLTRFFRPGKNVVGAILANGFRHLPTPDIFGHQRCEWTAPPSFTCELAITHADGRREVIRADESWRGRPGAFLFNCLRGGETIDASVDERQLLADAVFDDSWRPCVRVARPKGQILPDASLPVVLHEAVTPRRIARNRRGTLTVDFGRTLTGRVQFEAKARRDRRVVVRSNDLLREDGTVDIGNCSQFTYGRFQTDVALCSGRKRDRFKPRYSYKGFRYAEFIGEIAAVDRSSIKAVPIANTMPFAGELKFSDPRLAALHAACVNTFASSLHSLPDDSTREKMGWLGENGLHSYGQFLNFRVHRLYRKWLFDMLDTENPDGLISNMAPENGFWHRPPAGAPPHSHNDPWWCGSLIIVAWNLYLFYQDRGILETIFPAAQRLIGYITKHSRDGLVTWNIGDWCELDSKNWPQRSPIAATGTLALKLLADRMEQIALILHNREAAVHYRRLSKKTTAAFRAVFERACHDPVLDSQTIWGLILGLGVVAPMERASIAALLGKNIREGWDGHLSTGSIGTLPALAALGEYGLDDLAARILTDDSYPGYGYMLKQGATALWENWKGLESQCHVTYVGVHEFLYGAFGALRPDFRPGAGRCLLLAPGRLPALGDCRVTQRQPGFEYDAEWVAESNGVRATLSWRSEVSVFFDAEKCRRRGETATFQVGGLRMQPPADSNLYHLPREGTAELLITTVSKR